MLIAKACLEKGVEPYFFVASELWQRKGLAQNAFMYYYVIAGSPKRRWRKWMRRDAEPVRDHREPILR